MNDDKKTGLAAIYMLMPTLGGVLGFTAIGWYPYLLVSAMTGLIAWSLLDDRRSRKIYLGLLALAAIAGIVTRAFFQQPNASISDKGLILLVMPAIVVIGFYGMKIHSIESGDEDG